MATLLKKILWCICDMCGHEWQSSDMQPPTLCSKCKNPRWNKGGGSLGKVRKRGAK